MTNFRWDKVYGREMPPIKSALEEAMEEIGGKQPPKQTRSADAPELIKLFVGSSKELTDDEMATRLTCFYLLDDYADFQSGLYIYKITANKDKFEKDTNGVYMVKLEYANQEELLLGIETGEFLVELVCKK